MYEFIAKKGQLIAFLLGVLLTVVFLVIAYSGIEDFNMLSTEEQKQSNLFNFGLKSAIILGELCILVWFGFALYQMITHHIQYSIKGLIMAAVLVLLFVVLYSTNSGLHEGSLAAEIEQAEVSVGQSKLISAALLTTLVLAGLAIASFVVFEVRNIFK